MISPEIQFSVFEVQIRDPNEVVRVLAYDIPGAIEFLAKTHFSARRILSIQYLFEVRGIAAECP